MDWTARARFKVPQMVLIIPASLTGWQDIGSFGSHIDAECCGSLPIQLEITIEQASTCIVPDTAKRPETRKFPALLVTPAVFEIGTSFIAVAGHDAR